MMFSLISQQKTKEAKKRITLASLYLGTGPLEEGLVNIDWKKTFPNDEKILFKCRFSLTFCQNFLLDPQI